MASSGKSPDAFRIGSKLRELRDARAWSQVSLAERLGISQSRLSAVERGLLSLTAEEFLEALRLFNVPASDFARPRRDQDAQLQNALERLGATHLRESSDVLPSEDVKEATAVIREVMTAADSPRHITALGPVLVSHADRINFALLRAEFKELGLRGRLGWLIENTMDAIGLELDTSLNTRWRRLYTRAVVALESVRLPLNNVSTRRERKRDILDRDIRTQKSLDEIAAKSSRVSTRWNIVTSIQVEDFVAALRASRAAHR